MCAKLSIVGSVRVICDPCVVITTDLIKGSFVCHTQWYTAWGWLGAACCLSGANQHNLSAIVIWNPMWRAQNTQGCKKQLNQQQQRVHRKSTTLSGSQTSHCSRFRYHKRCSSTIHPPLIPLGSSPCYPPHSRLLFLQVSVSEVLSLPPSLPPIPSPSLPLSFALPVSMSFDSILSNHVVPKFHRQGLDNVSSILEFSFHMLSNIGHTRFCIMKDSDQIMWLLKFANKNHGPRQTVGAAGWSQKQFPQVVAETSLRSSRYDWLLEFVKPTAL